MKYLLIAAVVMISALFCTSCESTSSNAPEEGPPPAVTSPLGIDQPDPERIAQSAIAAYSAGRMWSFLAHFGFMNAETGKYFTPKNEEGDPFRGSNLLELKPLAQSLFPLMRSKSSSIVFGKPKTVRNRPLTVEVPFTVTYDFNVLTPAEKSELLREVNDSLLSQGQPRITFEQYEQRVLAMPNETAHRFIYREKKWFIDGATWRPYRVRQAELLDR